MKKKNKGEMNIGAFVMILIGVVVAIALFSGTFDSVGRMTNIYTVTNQTITTAAVNASTTLTGREATTAITVVNATSGVDWSDNFTVTTTNTAGSLAILLTTTDDAGLVGQNLTSVNVSYSYKPDGYNNDTGSRSIITLILIFSALAIAMIAFPDMRDGIFAMGK